MWLIVKNILLSAKFWKFAIPTLIILSVSGVIYYQHKEIKSNEKEILEKNLTIDKQAATIEGIQKDIKKIQEINKKVSVVQNDIAKSQAQLGSKLTKIEKQVISDPATANIVINQESVMRGRCFALATGAKPLPDEKNDVCPHLVKHD